MKSVTKDREDAAQTAQVKPQAERIEAKNEETVSDEDYWEQMIFISRGPTGWNIGCGCG